MTEFVGGALTLGYLVAGLFFLRFWRKTGDRLFAFFCTAFWLMAVNRFALTLVDVPSESRHFIYLIRLFAYLLILYGIVEKNRTRAPAGVSVGGA